jgi:hypothetical protein
MIQQISACHKAGNVGREPAAAASVHTSLNGLKYEKRILAEEREEA